MILNRKIILKWLAETYDSLKSLELNHSVIQEADNKSEGLTTNPLGRIPNWTREGSPKPRHVIKSNRYLKFQGKRIQMAINKKEFDKAVLLWCIILKNSKSYQVSLLHRTYGDWYYRMKRDKVNELIVKLSNKLARWDLKLILERFYIEKKNGKLRPIGSPLPTSRIISKALNDMIYHIFESKRSNIQHAYRKGYGTHTALSRVGELIRNGCQTFYEFDFKSFFNKVKFYHINTLLSLKCQNLGTLISAIMIMIEYKLTDIKEEAELKLTGQVEIWRCKELMEALKLNHHAKKVKSLNKVPWTKPVIERRGVPQGLSFSPLLATLLVEGTNPPKDLILYADDGLLAVEDPSQFPSEWFTYINHFGIELEPMKSRMQKSEFEFLGVTIDLVGKTMSYGGSKKSVYDKDFEHWLKTVHNKYGKAPQQWDWEIKPNSYIEGHEIKIKEIGTYLQIMKNSLWAAESFKGYRYFIDSGIYDVSGSSTVCSDALLRELKLLKFSKKKALWLRKRFDTFDYHIWKRGYVEKIINPPFSEYDKDYRGMIVKI